MPKLQPAVEDLRLAALQQWRNGLIDSGAVSRSSFKEAHLRLVLRSGRTEADQIRAMLPGSVADHAEELARVLREVADPETATPTPADVDSRGAADWAPQSGYARYTFRDSNHETAAISLCRSDAGDDGLQASWPRYVADNGASCIIYRLVSTDDDPGYSPDKAHLIRATTLTTAVDERPLTAAVRHLQVWVNVGESTAEAVDAQPVLHATGTVVGTLRDVEICEDSGRVIGQWTVPPGVGAVHVYRVPAELADHDGPAFRIAAGTANLTGFVDHDVERGRRYIYRLRCEVDVDGLVRLSEAVQREMLVSAVREPVTDLSLTLREERDGAAFDLRWTAPPFGRVRMFRTQDPPHADAQATELDESVLDQVGLTREVELLHPIDRRVAGDGVATSVMAEVPWPDDWNRAYITPVTVLDGAVRLGKPISIVRTGRITDVALLEYCSTQVLTFAWPPGAASVLVYIAPRGHDPRNGLTGRSYEIALADYEKYGGMRFYDDLPAHGCSLHLVPVAFSGGRQVFGVPASIEYGGLLRLWYEVHISRAPDGSPLQAAVRAHAENDATGSPPFVLVNNPERIPLTATDGQPVDMSPVDSQGQLAQLRCKEFQWSHLSSAGSEIWVGDVRGLSGWIRMFANLPVDRLRLLAVLDPPVDTLRLVTDARLR